MTASIIDGKAIAAQIRQNLRGRAEKLAASGHRPALAVVIAGDDPASSIYVRNKIKACLEVGVTSIERRLPAGISEADLLSCIRSLNGDPAVSGILVQLPLPAHISEQAVIAAIDPDKDVDGFHVRNAGSLMTGKPGFLPCTPYGCMKLIESTGCDPRGKRAVVIGRSNIVGKPMALMLLAADATVTIAHSKTPDLAAITREADILVSAVGRAHTVRAGMVKPGAIVIDVGMNRDEQGRLCGDVDTGSVMQEAGAITPVPGGVGPMTIAMLLENTIQSAERTAKNQ